jgi:hypothetical protein
MAPPYGRASKFELTTMKPITAPIKETDTAIPAVLAPRSMRVGPPTNEAKHQMLRRTSARVMRGQKHGRTLRTSVTTEAPLNQQHESRFSLRH